MGVEWWVFFLGFGQYLRQGSLGNVTHVLGLYSCFTLRVNSLCNFLP